MMEIQQHDSVVVEASEFQQGFTKCYWRRKRCHGRERKALGLRVRLPSLPSTIYRVLGGAPAPCRSHLGRGRLP